MGAFLSRLDHPFLGKRGAPPPVPAIHAPPQKKRRRTFTAPSPTQASKRDTLPASTNLHSTRDRAAPLSSHANPRTESRQPDPDRDPRDLQAPVRPDYVLRVVRDGKRVTIDPCERALYSDAFLERLSLSASVLVQHVQGGVVPGSFPKGGEGRTDWVERAPPAGHADQFNFLAFSMRKALRKKEVPVERAERVLAIVEKNEPHVVVGAFGEAERKRVDVRGKVILAPLTTQGNLPYRCIMKAMGVDITVGEMAVAENLLKGQPSEWALLRRHKTEDVFGVQIAGSNETVIARAAEIVSRECNVDFIDLNAGCPIDLICNRGSGCSLMTRARKFNRVVAAGSCASTVPFSVKIRTGFDNCHVNAHKLIPGLAACGAAWVTVHGRTRTQRYSRSADWEYISKSCAPAAAAAGIPLVANGDIYTWRDAAPYLDSAASGGGISGVMLARGALIKPWLATEIRERRDWDISSAERLELYREFCRAGLDHWGADERGVARTRKFLLEWLSFTYRYVPLGLMEVAPSPPGTDAGPVPISMRHRAPAFRGRNELETLFASHSADDWIKISEMFLGPVPKNFKFSARHNSNAWAAGAAGKK